MTHGEPFRELFDEELNSLSHATSEQALLALLQHPQTTESLVVAMLDRLDLPANVITAIAEKGSWNTSEAVRTRLASHPRTPKRVALAMVRQLYLFDLVRVSVSPSAPPDIRRLAEEMIVARVPHLPLGEKLTLARRGPARAVSALVAEGHVQAMKLGLSNPRLTESQVLRVLAKPDVPPHVVAAIGQHPKWSCQYNVRLALIRHPQTPAPMLSRFLLHATLQDLRDIAAIKTLGSDALGLVHNELQRRSTAGQDEVE